MILRRPARAAHPFSGDPDVPEDYAGRRRCTACGVMGAPGDSRHPATVRPVPPARTLPPELAAAAHRRDAAILGEKDDDE